MLCLSDDQVDQVLKTLQPETRKAIAMWNRDTAADKGVSNTRLSGPPEPEPRRFSGPPEPSARRLSSPPPPDTVPRPPQLSREAQQGQRIERYISGAPFMRPGEERTWVDVGPLASGSWQGWSNAGMNAPPVSMMRMETRPVRKAVGRTAREQVERTGPYASSHGTVREVSTSKGKVVFETRREVPRKEALEKGYINKDAKDAAADKTDAATTTTAAAAAAASAGAGANAPSEPPAKGSARAAKIEGKPTIKIEGKPTVYGPDLQRADVMEARKRAYELTSAIASERAENARLREELREEKARARDAARGQRKLLDKLQRQAGQDSSKLQQLEEKLAKAEGELKQTSTQHGSLKRETERDQRNREREKALDAGTIEALRREVKKLLTRLQEETLCQNELKELTVTLQEKLRSQTRLSQSLQEDVQNLEKEHARALKRLSVAESLNKHRAFQDRQASHQEREARAADMADLEATIRGQKAQIEELQRELHYLASTQSKDPEYFLAPAAAAGAEALEAARSQERLAMGERMREMAEEYRGKLDDMEAMAAEAAGRAQQAEDESRQAQERLASEQSKWEQRELEWKQRLEQHATALKIPQYASLHSTLDSSHGEHASFRSKATGAGAPMPGDVLLEITLNVSHQGLSPSETKALTHGVAQHVANAIRARKDTWRMLGLESDASPPVLHVALQHDVCYPTQTALEAGNEALRQMSDASSLLRSGEHASQIAGIKVTECGVDTVGARDAPDMLGSRSFGRRSSTLTAEDMAHCGNSKCSAMIQGLNRQLQDALFELSQVHKEAYHRSKQEDERVKQYRSDLGKLQEEAEARKSQLYDSSTTSDALMREYKAGAEQAQSRLKEATERMARREQEEKLKMSELCGEIEHLKLAQMQAARQVADAQQAQAAATSMAQQMQQERMQLLSTISNLQVELDVSTKSRNDEWHHRRAEDAAREHALAAAKQQIAALNERVIKLQHGSKANGAGSEIPGGPLSSMERDRMAALEQELREARTLESDAKMEIARFKSRLQLKEDECKLLAQRLDLAAATSAPLQPVANLTDLAQSEAAPKGAAGESGKAEAKAPDAPASEAAKNHLLAENASLKHELETSKMMQLEATRRLESAQGELEQQRTAAEAAADRLAHDLELAKKVAQEREVAIDNLCHERDRLHLQLQELLRESQRGSSVGASGAGGGEALNRAGGAEGQVVDGVCQKCDSMQKDNKQLFQDNQKLFRDNKRMAADLKSQSAELKESKEAVRRLEIENDALSRINHDMSTDQAGASPDLRSTSLENGKLRAEVESLRGELEDLHVVQELNRSLSDKLTSLSDEYKAERDSNRKKLAEMADAASLQQHEKTSLESKVSDLEEHIEKLRETSHDFSARNADKIQELMRSNEELSAQNEDLKSQVARLTEDLQVLRTVKKARGIALAAPDAPQTPGAYRGPGAEEASQLTMTLDMDMSEAGAEGSPERSEFEKDVISDVCDAAGVAQDRFRVLKLSPGSIMVDLAIMPDADGIAAAPSAIAADLKRQASDANSKLRAGKLTSRTRAIEVAPPAKGTLAPALPSEPAMVHQGRAAPPKTHAAPQMRLGASAPADPDGGEEDEVEKLADENQKLLGDNKRMFADCQRFVAELQQLHEENDQLVHDNRILIEDTQQLSMEAQEWSGRMSQLAGGLNEVLSELEEAVYDVDRLEKAEVRRLETETLSADEQRSRLEKAALYSIENRDLMDEHEVLVNEFKAMQQDKQVLLRSRSHALTA